MSAPTPIRALVHSRTLVTAGIFLVIKLGVIPLRSGLFLGGVFTLVVAGFIRVLETDLKKVVALSTLRQLGFIVVALRAGL